MADLVSHPDEVKVISKRFSKGATNLDRYLELDGYKAVEKALAMTPDDIINLVKNSGLRGRGGAGFSTGMKWSFVPKQSAKPKYILCNGDESEPGTCKDRMIFEHDPHAVIEGVMIAGLAVGATQGYIYIRGEYRYLSIIMQKAIADAYARGFLGKNIFGRARILTFTGTAARVLTKSVKNRHSWSRLKASVVFHASGLPFLLSSDFGAGLRSSTTPKPSPAFLTSCSAARSGMQVSARRKMAARACSA